MHRPLHTVKRAREYSHDKRLRIYAPGSYTLSVNHHRMLALCCVAPSHPHLHGLRQSSMCFRSTLGPSRALLASDCYLIRNATMPQRYSQEHGFIILYIDSIATLPRLTACVGSRYSKPPSTLRPYARPYARPVYAIR